MSSCEYVGLVLHILQTFNITQQFFFMGTSVVGVLWALYCQVFYNRPKYHLQLVEGQELGTSDLK